MTNHKNDVAVKDSSEKRGITRRTVTMSAAWAAPVIALAVGAPAAAASVTGGTLAFAPGPGTLNSGNNTFSYTWVISNASTSDPITGPFTMSFNVPFNIQASIPKPSAGQASATNPTLFAPVSVSAPGYTAAWIHQDASDEYGNTRTEVITVGDAGTTLAPGQSISITTEWNVPENWLSTGEGSIRLDRRIWTWRSNGTVAAAEGTADSPQSFPSWTVEPGSENPASPGGLWAFSTPAG